MKGGVSMRTKFHKLAGLILALVMMLSGIFGEALKVDAAFMCISEHSQESESCLRTSCAVLTGARSCTSEMMGIRRNADFGAVILRHANQRRGSGVSFGFLCQDSFFLKCRNSHVGLEDACVVSGCPYELVTEYIHKSDGKKRI